MDPYCNYRPFPSKENIMLLMSHPMTTVAIGMANAHFQKSPAVVTGRAHEQIRSFPARSCSLPVSRILRPMAVGAMDGRRNFDLPGRPRPMYRNVKHDRDRLTKEGEGGRPMIARVK